LHRLWDNLEKYGGHRVATNDITTWRIRVACWISKATCTYAHWPAHAPGYPHTSTRTHAKTEQYIIFIAFPRQLGFMNALHCYVTRTLAVLFPYLVQRYVLISEKSSLQCLCITCFVNNVIFLFYPLQAWSDLWGSGSHTVGTGEPRQSWIAHQTDKTATNRAHFHINFTSWLFTEYLALLFDFNHTVFLNNFTWYFITPPWRWPVPAETCRWD
jgi:hypothetical protein